MKIDFPDFETACGCGLMLLFVLILFASFSLTDLANPRTFNATITKTYVDSGNTFFVLQEDGKTPAPYCNNDNLFYGKFNSGDFLVSLEVGSSYTFTSVGLRVPLFSMFPNIVRYGAID